MIILRKAIATLIFIAIAMSSIVHSDQSSSVDEYVCNGEFFTVLADKMPWKSESDDCMTSFQMNRDRLKLLATSLRKMNSNLTIYSTLQNLDQCRMMFTEHPNLKIVSFDAVAFLRDYGYYHKDVIDKLNTWKLTGFVRSSDIIRLTIAHRFNQIYIDSDVHLLDLNLDAYRKSFVAVNVWQDIENALEISNCAFCLPKEILTRMMRFQQNRIAHGANEYHYTELGPSMFHKIIMNQNIPVALYSQNNPKATDLRDIAESIVLYKHKFLHLSTAIRKSNRDIGIFDIVKTIRQHITAKQQQASPPATEAIAPPLSSPALPEKFIRPEHRKSPQLRQRNRRPGRRERSQGKTGTLN